MMLLMISTALASLAMGVTLAYAVCLALFTVFRMRVQQHAAATLRIQSKAAGN
ncbi:MAG: hypothetical protein ACYDC6_09960 [Acidobacteriaceae bacterium]